MACSSLLILHPSNCNSLMGALHAGPWLYWLQATSAAGFAMLAFVQLQGVRRLDQSMGSNKHFVAAAKAATSGKVDDQEQESSEIAHSRQALLETATGSQAAAAAAEATGTRARGSARAAAAAPEAAATAALAVTRAPRAAATAAAARATVLAGPLRLHFIACCICMVAVVLLPQQGQFMAPTTLDSLPQPQLLASFSPTRLQQLLASARLLLLVAATPFVYHWGMTHLRSCFSVGEGMLLAQGASLTLVSAAGKLRMLPAFLPASMHQAFMGAAASATAAMRSGNATEVASEDGVIAAGLGLARSRHGAVQQATAEVPTFVLLLCGSMLCLCWLLWVLLRTNKHSTAPAVGGSTSKASSCISSQESDHKSSHISSTLCSNASSSSRTGSSRSSHSSSMLAVPHMSTAAAAASLVLPAAVIVCLAAWTLLEFLPQTPQRAGVLVYWVMMLAASLLAMHIVAHRTRVPQVSLCCVVAFAVRYVPGLVACMQHTWHFALCCSAHCCSDGRLMRFRQATNTALVVEQPSFPRAADAYKVAVLVNSLVHSTHHVVSTICRSSFARATTCWQWLSSCRCSSGMAPCWPCHWQWLLLRWQQ